MEVTMKTKKFNKKLTLNKETVTNLSDIDLKSINGGLPGFSWETGCTNETNCDSINQCGTTYGFCTFFC